MQDFTCYRRDEVLGAWKPYDIVLKNALRRTCRRHGIDYVDADGQRIYDAVPTWGPHPDVPEGLRRLAKRYPLVILSNASNAQIHSNVEKLGAPFHAVYHGGAGTVLQAAHAGIRVHARLARCPAGGIAACLSQPALRPDDGT